MRFYFEQQWSLVTLTEKLFSRGIQLKKSVGISKLANSVKLTGKILQSNQKLQLLLMHKTL